MIPKWRYVHYTDDGCALYQCLNCYKQWEGRSWPGYTHDGAFTAVWKFCPYCGVEWTGSTRTQDCELGPRRTRIQNAIDSRRWNDKPTEPFWWMIECRDITTRVRPAESVSYSGWYPDLYLPWWAGAVKVRNALVQQRRQREGDTDWLTSDEPPYVKTYQYRARIVKSLPHNSCGKVCWWVDKL